MPAKPFVGVYRSQSGRSYFRWSFEHQANGDVRAYILNAPGYGNKPSGGHETHRFADDDRHYICYQPMPQNLEDAIAVAKEWAERTERYIIFSEEF